MKTKRSVYALIGAASLAALTLGASGAAQAGNNDVFWSVGLSSPGVSVGVSNGQSYYSQPQVVYSQPQVVYSQPQVVYSQPQVIYAQPQPMYVQPHTVYVQPQRVYYPQVAPVYVAPRVVYNNGWQHPRYGWQNGGNDWQRDHGNRGQVSQVSHVQANNGQPNRGQAVQPVRYLKTNLMQTAIDSYRDGQQGANRP